MSTCQASDREPPPVFCLRGSPHLKTFLKSSSNSFLSRLCSLQPTEDNKQRSRTAQILTPLPSNNSTARPPTVSTPYTPHPHNSLPPASLFMSREGNREDGRSPTGWTVCVRVLLLALFTLSFAAFSHFRMKQITAEIIFMCSDNF